MGQMKVRGVIGQGIFGTPPLPDLVGNLWGELKYWS